ncbi:MAG: arylsulfotransferase family protein, partial [Opitutaceae bacterium]
NPVSPMSPKPIGSLWPIIVSFCALALGHAAAAEPYPGYTFFSSGTTAYLYNLNKEVVHQWSVAEGSVQTSPYLLTDGSVLFPLNKGGFTFRPAGAHPSGTFQRIAWDGALLWDFQFFGPDFTPSYDVTPLPNGNILVCASFQDRNLPGKVFEIKPVGKNGGEVVWECDVSAKLGAEVKGYINSIGFNPVLNQVLVNIQTPGKTLAIFDHRTPAAELVFKWSEGISGRLHGGSWVTDRYVGTDLVIPGSDAQKMRVGNILTVSNGDKEMVEVDPRTNQRVKAIKYDFSDHQGSVQRLPNGNTLIVSGNMTKIDEVDDDGKVVWSMETPGKIARALRYGLSYPGVSNLGKK